MMADPGDGPTPAQATASGHALSGVTWLDAHFERSRAVYEAMARAGGLEPGWRVLDGGCGPGSSLPTLAALVGPGGSLTALDLDAENLATAEGRVAAAPLACPVAFRQGSVTALPFPDRIFDAVWCANVSQYLTDEELVTALAECRRVVRPGGLVAVKESDALASCDYPMDMAIWWRTTDALVRQGDVQTRGVVRAAALRRWLERAGLEEVRQRLFPEEFWAPLPPPVRDARGAFLRFIASLHRANGSPGGRPGLLARRPTPPTPTPSSITPTTTIASATTWRSAACPPGVEDDSVPARGPSSMCTGGREEA